MKEPMSVFISGWVGAGVTLSSVPLWGLVFSFKLYTGIRLHFLPWSSCICSLFSFSTSYYVWVSLNQWVRQTLILKFSTTDAHKAL